MFFKVDPSNGIAIYEQLVRQVIYAIAAGALRAGDLVPSVREMAKQLAINPNTVARAYQELQNANVLETVRGTGLAVTEAAVQRSVKERTRLVRDRMNDVAGEARQAGLERDAVQSMFQEEVSSVYAARRRR